MVSNYQFPVLAIGLVLFAIGISFNKKLRFLAPIVLTLGIVSLYLAHVAVFFANEAPTYPGLWQRAAIGLPYSIMMIIAFTLYKNQDKLND